MSPTQHVRPPPGFCHRWSVRLEQSSKSCPQSEHYRNCFQAPAKDYFVRKILTHLLSPSALGGRLMTCYTGINRHIQHSHCSKLAQNRRQSSIATVRTTKHTAIKARSRSIKSANLSSSIPLADASILRQVEPRLNASFAAATALLTSA